MFFKRVGRVLKACNLLARHRIKKKARHKDEKSKTGLSECLYSLLITYGRRDLLNYGRNQFMRLATWSLERSELDVSTLAPAGAHF